MFLLRMFPPLCFLALFFSPGMLHAAPPTSDDAAGLRRFYNQIDQNSDNRVSHAEFENFWTRLFNNTDKNKDGVHDQTEILRGHHFEVFDINKDGVITLEEELSVRNRHWKSLNNSTRDWASIDHLVARGRGKGNRHDYEYESTFTKMDADRDGLLTKEEYLGFWRAYFESRDSDDDGLLTDSEHGHTESFDSFDANNDKKIDSAEDADVRRKDFKKLDADGNGSLTQSEFVR